jgi:hypothetical protein
VHFLAIGQSVLRARKTLKSLNLRALKMEPPVRVELTT